MHMADALLHPAVAGTMYGATGAALVYSVATLKKDDQEPAKLPTKDMDNTKLIASHDLDMIYDLCDRVMLIAEGKLIADGEAKAILTDKELLETNRLELSIALAKDHYN